MTAALPEPWPACPTCHVSGPHLIEHRPSPPGAYATWPEELAPHWLRTCCFCDHEWRQPG